MAINNEKVVAYFEGLDMKQISRILELGKQVRDVLPSTDELTVARICSIIGVHYDDEHVGNALGILNVFYEGDYDLSTMVACLYGACTSYSPDVPLEVMKFSSFVVDLIFGVDDTEEADCSGDCGDCKKHTENSKRGIDMAGIMLAILEGKEDTVKETETISKEAIEGVKKAVERLPFSKEESIAMIKAGELGATMVPIIDGKDEKILKAREVFDLTIRKVFGSVPTAITDRAWDIVVKADYDLSMDVCRQVVDLVRKVKHM